MKTISPDHFQFDLNDGKYTIVFDEKGLRALRWGEPWRGFVGDNLVYAMASEIRHHRGLYEQDD